MYCRYKELIVSHEITTVTRQVKIEWMVWTLTFITEAS